MTPREAIKAAGTDKWFRPVTWRGTMGALEVSNGYLHCVPSLHGGFLWHARVSDLQCEWEAVEPGEVLTERDEP